MFGGYLIVHLVVNATIAQGTDPEGIASYQTQVDKIHSLPFLEAVEWSAIFIPFLFHAFYGLYIAVTGRPNVGNYPFTKNVYYLLQRISAVIVLAFVFFHVLSLKFGAFGTALQFDAHGNAMTSIHTHMTYAWWMAALVYPIGILAATYHTANGFWTAAITWGLTVSSASQKRFGLICTGLFVVLTVFGLVALAAAVRYQP
jgi:succinate dehydrogenase cytochrome b subunit